ncbi:hypothetical protein LSTR_LSTR002712 [Laodelphax striatellus]|uniref:Zinc finger matrin-type protein 5 n=1 Tax=Laodelphax striatellus TaxID=195883 RepID=A0A482X6Q1_LAOST|nr:hypothetical protein LSTR_LSTR002712 [Laodelphax striatellus]
MGKRYYCDYCDRSFIDDLEARKKHLNGTLHIRNKKLHYKQFRDLKTIVQEETTKVECRKFLQTGECHYGEHCNFTHYSRAQINELILRAREEEQRKLHPEIVLPTVDSWLERRRKKLNPTDLIEPEPLTQKDFDPDLPPSMQPINYKNVLNKEVSTWG